MLHPQQKKYSIPHGGMKNDILTAESLEAQNSQKNGLLRSKVSRINAERFPVLGNES